eukprot:gene20623-22658_t
MERFNVEDFYDRRKSSAASIINDSDIFARIKPPVTRREIFHRILVALVIIACLLSCIAILLNYMSLQRSKRYSKEMHRLIDKQIRNENTLRNRQPHVVTVGKRKPHRSKLIKTVAKRKKTLLHPRNKRFVDGNGVMDICDKCNYSHDRKQYCCTCHVMDNNETI